jgi:hypothetical protein
MEALVSLNLVLLKAILNKFASSSVVSMVEVMVRLKMASGDI